MKQCFLFVLLAGIMAACSPGAESENDDVALVLVSEDLTYYALTEIDSVYSIGIRLQARDTLIAKYKVTLTQELETYTDSLILDIDGGQVVTGQIIFPHCRVKNRKRPTFTSNLTVIEN